MVFLIPKALSHKEHIIIVIIIQIQMKNLAYIPTKIDKQKLYA